MTTTKNRSPRPATRTGAPTTGRTANQVADRAALLAEVDDLTSLRAALLDFLIEANDDELAEFAPGLARVSTRIAYLLDQLDS